MLSNNKIVRAHSTEEYVDMINQAIDETFDLRQAIEFDEEFMSEGRVLVDELEACLKALYESMKDGSYQFGRNDLPLMRVIKKHTENDLPCIRLFYTINQTHRQGLDVSDG